MKGIDLFMKKIISIIIMLVVMFSLAVTVAAVYTPAQTETKEAVVDISPIWEQTQWFFRVNNGVLEQRLWSQTFGRWLTDWHPAQ